MNYKPSDFIYYSIVQEGLNNGEFTLEEGQTLTLDNSEELFYYYEDDLYDILYEARHEGKECNLSPTNYIRHYEVDFYVKEFTGITESGEELSCWVGWDYYYGGGKHSEPEAFDWIGNSVFVNVASEEVVTVVKRTFEREVE